MSNPYGPATTAIHLGQQPDPVTGAVVPSISLATTFVMDEVGVPRSDFDYSRSGNPTRSAAELTLAALEHGERGFAFPSGLSAEDTLLRVLTRPGDVVLYGHDTYGGTYRLLDKVLPLEGRKAEAVDLLDVEAVLGALARTSAKVLWVETPSNPLLDVADISALAAGAHAHGAVIVVDNTFASPVLQSPLLLGADVVTHSTTKFITGHSDVVGGAVVTATNLQLPASRVGASGSTRVADELAFWQNSVGSVPGVWDAWLTSRGLKTLQVRVERASANAQRIAEHFAANPASGLQHVIYPGLTDHPGHEIAARQMRGFGALVTLQFDSVERAHRVCQSTKLFALAVSLGSVESLIEHPASMTHMAKSDGALAIPGNIVRLAVGIENVEDLIADLEQALA